MMEICTPNDNQFYSNRLFEEIENSIHFIFNETQKFEENVNACFDQIQQLGDYIMQNTHFDEYHYNQIFMQLESNKSGIIAISDELKNNVLLKWKIRQQELSVGCINENDVFNQTLLQSLQSIDGSIVHFAAVLNRLINSKSYFVINSLEGNKIHLNSIQTVDNALHLHMLNILTDTKMAIEAYRNFLFGLIGDLFKSSIIVYKQPPAIVTMFETRASTKKPNDVNKNDGESKKSSRNSRFSFDTEICLLGEQFWYHSYGVIAEVKCEVDLLAENDDGEQKFTIQPSSVGFCPPDPKDPKTIRSIHNIVKSTALFPNMKILKVEKRPHGVKNRRYAIRYEMASPFGNISKLSLPFAIVNGKPDLEIDTLLFMERSFANLCIQIVNMGTVMIEGHNSTFDDYHKSLTKELRQMNIENNRVIEALELKFRRIAQKNEDVQLRLFTDHDKKHLLQILEQPIPKHLAEKGRECKCYQCECRKNEHVIVHGKISLSSIIDHIVCMKFVTNNGKTCLQDSTFNEWFNKVAEIVGVLKKHWNSGEIFGFCDQTVAEALVLAKLDRILIRFADTMQGQLRLSMADSKTPQKYTLQGEEKERPKVRHITIKYAENVNSVNSESFYDDQQFYNLIKTAAKLYNINHIYEDFKIDLESSFEEETNLLASEYNENTYSLTRSSVNSTRINNSSVPYSNNSSGPYSNNSSGPFSNNSSVPYSNNSSGPYSNNSSVPYPNNSSEPYSNNSSVPYSNNSSKPSSNFFKTLFR